MERALYGGSWSHVGNRLSAGCQLSLEPSACRSLSRSCQKPPAIAGDSQDRTEVRRGFVPRLCLTEYRAVTYRCERPEAPIGRRSPDETLCVDAAGPDRCELC